MTEFRLERPGNRDLVFDGEVIADQSSFEEGTPYWKEIRIYRTERGRYVAEERGKAADPETPDKGVRVTVCNTTDEVRTALESVRREEPDRRYLTHLALDALDEAAENDPAFDPAIEERI